MKRQLLLSLAFSVIAANAIAMPAAPEQVSGQAVPHTSIASEALNTLAEGGADHVIKQDRFAQDGSDRTLNRLAQDGSERTLYRLAQDGSDYVRAQHES